MSEARRIQRLTDLIPRAAAALSIAVAVAVLASWLLDVPWLRAPIPGQVSMKANTAAGFLAAGLLLAAAIRPQSGWRMALRWGLEALLLSLGLLTLAQYLFGIDLRLDQLLVDAPSDALYTISPGRMAPTTAIGFTLFALTLVADHWQTGPGRGFSRACATVLLIVALTSLLGYAYGAPTLYLGIDGVTAMALMTAILFLAIAVGAIWLRADYGFPAMLAERSVVGTHIRSLLPMIIAAPLLVGAAVAAGYGRLYEGQFAIALTSLGSVIAAGLVAAVSIVVLRRADNALYVKDRALAATTNGIVITDHRAPDEPVVFTNNAFTEITGYTANEVLGRNCRLLNESTDNDADTLAELRRCLETGCDGVFELENRRKDGTTFWNRLSLAPVENYEGTITHFVGVMDDVTEKREQERELQRALEDAQTANSMRDTFVRLVSHELRTPLNAALTWIRLMEVDDRAETLSTGLTVIARSIESQSRLIDDLVDVTRFQTVGVRLESETVDARELVELTIEELRPTIEPNRTVDIRIDATDYSARLDPLRLRQIVRNLVSNASKYTPEGGHIDVALGVAGNNLELRVADTGKGMTAAELRRVFEPFWRADNNLPGLGVGLAIVAALVAAHDGTIVADSDGPGKGSVFTVRLPLDASPSGLVQLHDEDVAAAVDAGATTSRRH